MPKKKHHKTAPPVSSAALRGRAERAMQEGRFQQGLELAKQLHKSEPTPAHQDLVRRAYLGRARQLRNQGHTRDAAAVLRAALAFDHAAPAWLGQVAAELAQVGEVKEGSGWPP